MHKRNYGISSGFTIVELLVVIVVIGILAAITIISYSGISQRAVAVSLQSDLASAKKQLQIYQTENDSYPEEIDDCPTPADGNLCIGQPSSGNSFTDYSVNNTTNPPTFTLGAFNGTVIYHVTNDLAPVAVTGITCPTGFIVVPGSTTYGTSDFCVMKYEAKNVGGVATSQAAGTPWTLVDHNIAVPESAEVCTGCHLVTEAEWLTIAQNVLGVASNWDNGAGVHAVGTGYIYNGHNDLDPEISLAADASDANGYSGTGNASPSSQRRTLTLSNGEVIWDLAGNVWEWTAGTVENPGVQPGVTSAGWDWRQWADITNPGTLSPNPSPATTGIAGSAAWTSNHGIGMLFSNSDYTDLRCFNRGGSYDMGYHYTGVLALGMYYGAGSGVVNIGFRVAK